ncbi:hypothetical protein D3Y57_05490 [Sphingomonas paeninsulae]|uniref:Uncharacterized protein n=1 Tax=Sphingomonas paeninsulae TaxID=2319844 RepID=A0A494TEU2_SPHPE|nr:hypothetical protein [Sphingomonas paeninsulae]AYJ85533.1 hypothetical protein D3Y57_05490 [Sphingomonas paeninsulae]
MGLLSGSTKTTTVDDPWAPQGTALKGAFDNAKTLYDSKANSPAYSGPNHAGIDPLTGQAIQGTADYVNGQGATTVGALGNAGTTGLGAQGNQLSTIGALATAGGVDPTQTNITNAGAYADNPYLEGQITAASRDVTRNLSEVALPSIDRAATGTGNINSTRAGVASGIAQRGAQDQIGDIASTMRSDAYQKGLTLAEQSRATNLDATSKAAGLYGDAVNTGLNASAVGNATALANQDALAKAGQIKQADTQAQYDADKQSWTENDTRATTALQNYYGIVGDKDWGGTTTATAKTTGSVLGGILGAVTAGTGLAKVLKG